jgi:hypothetical protein
MDKMDKMDNNGKDKSIQQLEVRDGINLKELKLWYSEYMAADSNKLDASSTLVEDLKSDILDLNAIELEIQQSMSTTNVSRGFCEKCQYLFDHWPNLGDESWTNTIAMTCITTQLESAARLGCKLCAFLLTKLRRNGLLEIFRKIENRTTLLDEHITASLTICNWGTSGHTQLLWLNFPGKSATGCNDPGAQAVKFESHTLSSTGT